MIEPQDLEYALETLQELPRTELYSALAGTVAFSSTLALSTFFLHQVLRISTATTKPIPSLCGIASVCLASVASHEVAIATNQYVVRQKLPAMFDHRDRTANSSLLDYRRRDQYLDFYYIQIPLHSLRICCLGLLTFKLLGGRFWSVAPSSYVHLGSFARPRWFSLPATLDYASDVKRLQLQRMGRLAGCHTCGTRMLFQRPRFNGDHMPPLLVADQLNRIWWRKMLGKQVRFRFFPQCVDCSSTQGGILSKARGVLDKTKKNPFQRWCDGTDLMKLPVLHSQRYNHGLQPRISHLTGSILGGVAVAGASQGEIADSNRKRYERLHGRVKRLGKSVRENDVVVDILSSLRRP